MRISPSSWSCSLVAAPDTSKFDAFAFWLSVWACCCCCCDVGWSANGLCGACPGCWVELWPVSVVGVVDCAAANAARASKQTASLNSRIGHLHSYAGPRKHTFPGVILFYFRGGGSPSSPVTFQLRHY